LDKPEQAGLDVDNPARTERNDASGFIDALTYCLPFLRLCRLMCSKSLALCSRPSV
jgi:hypothetical protein